MSKSRKSTKGEAEPLADLGTVFKGFVSGLTDVFKKVYPTAKEMRDFASCSSRVASKLRRIMESRSLPGAPYRPEWSDVARELYLFWKNDAVLVRLVTPDAGLANHEDVAGEMIKEWEGLPGEAIGEVQARFPSVTSEQAMDKLDEWGISDGLLDLFEVGSGMLHNDAISNGWPAEVRETLYNLRRLWVSLIHYLSYGKRKVAVPLNGEWVQMNPPIDLPFEDPLPAEILDAFEENAATLRRAVKAAEGTPPADEKPQKTRGAFQRDHFWLKWKTAEGASPAVIHNRWNRMTDQERKEAIGHAASPGQLWQRIAGGNPGREVVKAGLFKAAEEAKNDRV